MNAEFFNQCCSCRDESSNEFQVLELTSEIGEVRPHLLTQHDSIDMMMVTPRKGDEPRVIPVTPLQRHLKDCIQLPNMRRYPMLPSCKPEDPEEWRRLELLKAYQEFVLDLHKGIHLTQLTSNQEHSDIHCQILEDLQTLIVDTGNGCIIEFPLSAVSKVHRVVKNDDKWFSAGSVNGPTPLPPLPISNAEHIVVVEFMKRKLAFVFNEATAAQTFLMCLELLIRRAQECRVDVDPTYRPKAGIGTRQMSNVFSGNASKGYR